MDYNNDGLMDLIASHLMDFGTGGWTGGDSSRATAAFRQLPDGGFRDAGYDFLGTYQGSVALADVDGNGALDLLTTGFVQTRDGSWQVGSRFYRNLFAQAQFESRGNTPPTPPTGLQATHNGATGETILQWDHGTDAQTPQEALAYNIRVGTWPGAGDIVSPASCAPVTPLLRSYRITPDQPGLILRNLPPGHYYWSVRTVDGGRMASSWTPHHSFSLRDGHLVEDFNQDTVFDAADLVRFARMVHEFRDDLPLLYDFNEDGRISQADVRTLARRLLGATDLFPGDYTIGPGGGVITLDGLELSVPPGSFTTPAVLTIERVEITGPYGSEQAPEVYRISGLPAVTEGPCHIALVAHEPPGDMPLVLVGEESFALDGGEGGGVRYRFVEPEILADGRHRIEVPALGDGEERKAAAGGLQTYTLETGVFKWGYVKRVSGPFFRIYHPYHMDVDAVTDLMHMGFFAAYRKLRDDFGFSYARRTGWPVDVYVQKLSNPDEAGALVTSIWGVNHMYIEINEAIMGDRVMYNTTASHEFFHLVQGLYDPAGRIEQATREKYPRWWLDEAMSTWAEELVAPWGYIPPDYVRNIEQPFVSYGQGGIAYGLNAGGKDATLHGYGMAPLPKFLAERRKESLHDFYQSIRSGSDPVWALRHALPDEYIGDWYNDYFHQLVEGKLYPYGNAYATFASIATGARMLRLEPADGTSATSKSFDVELPDLSAAPYLLLFTADYPDPPADAVFVVSYEGDPGLGLQVFRLGRDEWAKRVTSSLGLSSTRLEIIPDALEYKATRAALLTLVTNTTANSPYTDKREGRLSLALAQSGPMTLQENHHSATIYNNRPFPTLTGKGSIRVDAYAGLHEQLNLPVHYVQAEVWGAEPLQMEITYQADIEALSDTWQVGDTTRTLSTTGIESYTLWWEEGDIERSLSSPTGHFIVQPADEQREDRTAAYSVWASLPMVLQENGVVVDAWVQEWPLLVFLATLP